MNDRHPSPDSLASLIARHLDGELSGDEEQRLNSLVAADRGVAEKVVRAALLHDRLRDMFREDAVGADLPTASPVRSARSRWAVALLAIAVVVVLAVLPRASNSGSAAHAALDRIVAAAASASDRTYRITVLDHGGGETIPPVPAAGGGRKPGVDGARLFIRGADRFVLVRRFGDGTEFVTGSDGTIGWAVPPRGRVHLSRDPRRFRRGVPGEHEEVPFLDVRSGLDGLRRGYDLALSTAAEGGEQLEAVRRAGRRRGPQRVHVWFDATGVATRILIEGLAIEDGMPRAVRLDLLSQDDLGDDFFNHEAHHASDRLLEWE
jgi:hypothetical protein